MAETVTTASQPRRNLVTTTTLLKKALTVATTILKPISTRDMVMT